MPDTPKEEIPIAGQRLWTQHELDTLHEMVLDYDRARWFRRQAKWWLIWALGVPTAFVTFYKSIDDVIKLWRGH